MKRILRALSGLAFGGMVALAGLLMTPGRAEAVKCWDGSAPYNTGSCSGTVCCFWWNDTFQGCTGGYCVPRFR